MTDPLSSYEIVWILGKDISVVWENAQRPRRQREIDRIANEFDPDLLGVLTLTMPNGSGIHHCIDGQTRHAAVVQLMGENQRLPCIVLPFKDVKRAAELFAAINSAQVKPQPIELFLVRVTAGHEDEVATNNVIEEVGYRVHVGNGERNIRAVSACLAVYRRHGSEILRNTLRTIRDSWGYDQHAVEASMIRGYGQLIAAAGPVLDRKRLINRISKEFSPGRLMVEAKTQRGLTGRGTMATNLGVVVRLEYNKGLRAAQRLELPE